DTVDDDDPAGVAPNTGKVAQRVGEPGRRFVVCEQQHLRLRVARNYLGEVVRVNGLAPLELQTHDVRAVGGGQGSEAFAEVAAERHEHLVTRRHQVGDRGFEATGARRGEQQQVVGRLED